MRQSGHGLADHRQFSRLDQLILRRPEIGLNLLTLRHFLLKLIFLRIQLAQGMAQQARDTPQFIAPVNRDSGVRSPQTDLHHGLVERGKTLHQPGTNEIMVKSPGEKERQQRRQQNKSAADANNLFQPLVKHLHLLMATSQLRFKQCSKAPERCLSGVVGINERLLRSDIIAHRIGHFIFHHPDFQQFINGLPQGDGTGPVIEGTDVFIGGFLQILQVADMVLHQHPVVAARFQFIKPVA